MFVFMNGKQVRVRRPPTIDGMDAEEFIRHNADPIWLHQHGYWEILQEHAMEEQGHLPQPTPGPRKARHIDDSNDLPF